MNVSADSGYWRLINNKGFKLGCEFFFSHLKGRLIRGGVKAAGV